MEAKNSVLPLVVDSFYLETDLETDKEIFSARPTVEYIDGWIYVTAFSERSRFEVKIHNSVKDGVHDFAGENASVLAVYDFDIWSDQAQKMKAESGVADVIFNRVSGKLSVEFSCALSPKKGFTAKNGKIQLTTSIAKFPGWLTANVDEVPFNTEIVMAIKDQQARIIVAAFEAPIISSVNKAGPRNKEALWEDIMTISFPLGIKSGDYVLGGSEDLQIRASYFDMGGAEGAVRSGRIALKDDTDAKRMAATFEFNTENVEVTDGRFNISYADPSERAPGSTAAPAIRNFEGKINGNSRKSSTLVLGPMGTLIVELDDNVLMDNYLMIVIPHYAGVGEYKIVPIGDPDQDRSVVVRYDDQIAESGTMTIQSVGWGNHPSIKAFFNCTNHSHFNIQDALFEITRDPDAGEQPSFTAVFNGREIIASRLIVVDMASSRLMEARIDGSTLFHIRLGNELADGSYTLDAERINVLCFPGESPLVHATNGTLVLSTSSAGVRSGTFDFDHPGYKLTDGKFSFGDLKTRPT